MNAMRALCLVTGDGMEKRDLISYQNDYQILTEGSRSGLANCNYQSGEVGHLDAAADSFTPWQTASHNPRRVGVLLLPDWLCRWLAGVGGRVRPR